MPENSELIDINQAAAILAMKPPSVRARLYREGDLWGVKPLKAPNGRNLFPASEVRALITERIAGAEPAKA
ncbi:hypothetical protein PQR75_46920 [Paraburkholderia fungorum]|uniref:hypothetical protein n=1 Tax=Paraburkholderia fungorum TaxID=134537 RepID=UPI0038BB051A